MTKDLWRRCDVSLILTARYNFRT